MKKIVLLTDFYYPNPSANGICIKKIADELVKEGHEVFVVAYGIGDFKEYENVEGVNVYKVKAPFFYQCREAINDGRKEKKLFPVIRVLRYIRVVLLAPMYPMLFPKFAKKYYKLVMRIVNENNIGKIVAEYIPIEAAYSGYIAKKKNKNLSVDLYVVDTFTQGENEIRHPLYGWFCARWEKKFLNICDTFYCMRNFNEYYSTKEFEEYNRKIEFVGLPLIQNNCCTEIESHEEINFLYAGSWGGERNPDRIFEQLNKLYQKGEKIQFFYCGKNNERAKKYEIQYSFFRNCGFLNEAELKKLCKKIDYMVNIGNSTNMLPSKLFSYISFGIPILHFYLTETDPCFEYLKVYPFSVCLNLSNFSSDDLKISVDKYLGCRTYYKDLKEKYDIFTPEYISRRLTKKSELLR